MLKNINNFLRRKQKSQSVIVARLDPIEGTSPEKVYDYFKRKYTNNEDITNGDMKKLQEYATDIAVKTIRHGDVLSNSPIIYKDYKVCVNKLYRFLYLFNFNENIDDNKFILAPELTNAYKIIKIISDYFMLYIEISLYVIRYHYIRALYYENEIADYGSFIVNIFKLL
jgi:hypothetical protein